MPFPRGRPRYGRIWLEGRESQYLVSRPCTGTGEGKRIAEKGCLCVHKFNSFPTEFEMETSKIRNLGLKP